MSGLTDGKKPWLVKSLNTDGMSLVALEKSLLWAIDLESIVLNIKLINKNSIEPFKRKTYLKVPKIADAISMN